MIEESLLKSNFVGKDGFIWWIGQVAPAKVWRNEKSKLDAGKNQKDSVSPSWAYRCKVRIIGYHTFDGGILPDEQLPWAHVSVGAETGSGQGGVGQSMRLVGGETVYGFFLDGDDAQQPVIVGCLHRNESTINLVNQEFLETEKSSQFNPFPGNSGKLIQGPTQIRRLNDATQQQPKGNTTGEAKSPGLPEAPRDESKPGADQLIRYDLATQQWETEYCSVKIIRENGCNDNLIGKIQKVMEEFLNFVSSVQSVAGKFVDVVKNVFVDLPSRICEFASRIIGIVKFMINNIRNGLLGKIGKLFLQLIGIVVPEPQKPPIAAATKNVNNIIFCLFERLLSDLLPWLCDFLDNMVGNVINSPLCAVQQSVAAILSKIMGLLDKLLAPVLSGISWLVGGLGTVSNLLSTVSSVAAQIMSFLGCDSLKCETPTQWSPCGGSRIGMSDGWSKVFNLIDDIKGLGNLDLNYGKLSPFGYSGSSSFSNCTNKTLKPTKQEDQISLPPGIKAPYCIPPEIVIFGDGVRANAVPIVGDRGNVIAVKIINRGVGYSKPPSIYIIDNTNHGSGATAKATIEDGKIKDIYLTNQGSGYCKGDYSVFYDYQNYLVTANKYTFFEGETVTFTLKTENVPNATKLKYKIAGDVRLEDFQNLSSMTGYMTVNSGTATVSFKFRQDSMEEILELMYFDLYDQNDLQVCRTLVLLNNTIAPMLAPEPPYKVQSPRGTTYPEDGGGTVGIGTTGIFTGISTVPPFTGIGTVGFGTFIGIGTIGSGIATSGIGTNVVGIITGVIPEIIGTGYTNTDTIVIGICTFSPIIGPNGSIIGVSTNFCPTEFTEIPQVTILTDTGEGAILRPILEFSPTRTTGVITINQFGVVSVIDCV